MGLVVQHISFVATCATACRDYGGHVCCAAQLRSSAREPRLGCALRCFARVSIVRLVSHTASRILRLLLLLCWCYGVAGAGADAALETLDRRVWKQQWRSTMPPWW
jgi:hypothetical protein